LYSVMCLDPSIVSPAGESATFDQVKKYLSSNENAHANNSYHLKEYVSACMPHADRYVFCIHQDTYRSAVPFLQRCTNLKIIIITIDSIAGMYLTDKRRSFLGRNIRDEIAKLTYCVKPGEIERLAKFGSLIGKQTNSVPGLIIDVKDYWNCNIAISVLNKYFSEHNIKCNNWEELYHIWLANSINVCLK